MLTRGRWREKLLTLAVVAIVLSSTLIASKIGLLESLIPAYQKEKFPAQDEVTNYSIQASFDPKEKVLTAQEQVTYVNQHGKLEFLYFHLYPNAFQSEDTAPFEKSEMKRAYPNGFEPGMIEIHSIEAEGQALHFSLMGKGNTILKVNLNQPLQKKESIELTIQFTVKIPPSYGRFGYGENTVNICNWYPILSVFDGKGWNLEPYHPIGDPFYSDVSKYRVELLIPQEYTLCFTGNLLKKENIDGKVRWTIEAEAVRDFAMVASEKFKTAETEIDGIQIISYFFEDEYGEQALQTAKDSIQIFNRLYRPYPYKQFSVAAADFFIGGMEYPNLVLIDQTLYSEERKDILEYVIAHEVAHQWWYGIVGNDQIREPWLDEALTEYATLLYYEKKYGQEVKNQIFEEMMVKSYQTYQEKIAKQAADERIYRSIKEFENGLEYQVLVYHKGAMFLEDLRRQLGDKTFFNIFKVYFDKYRYKNATTKDFIKICEQAANRDLKGIFKEWIGYDEE